MIFFKKSFLSFWLFSILFALNSQEYNLNSPIDLPLNLSGTFGEFRSSHFHYGLDVTTNKKPGYNVYSIDSGSVVRINVSTSGYGKALYINHPNGLTSVYAHLKEFSPKIQEYIKTQQYLNKSYNVQKFFNNGEMKVNKGDLIGYTGNTGGSSGPHLHFEIRDTKSQNPINPLSFNYKYDDSNRPIIKSLYLFNEDDIFKKRNPKKYEIKKINDSLYMADKILYSNKIGIGIEVYDRQSNNNYNRNGVYEVKMFIDSVLNFSYKMDKINIDESVFRKIFYDYLLLKTKKKRIQKVYYPLNSKLNFLNHNVNTGIFKSSDKYEKDVLIEVSDWNNNKSYLNFKIEGITSNIIEKSIDGIEVVPSQKYLIKKNNIEIGFKKNSFFNKVALNIEYQNDTLRIDEDIYPLRKSYNIKIYKQVEDSIIKRQSYIGLINKNGTVSYLKTNKKDNFFSTNSSILGSYTLSRDSINPEVQPLNFSLNKDISDQKTIRLRIYDKTSGIKSYNVLINNKWALFEHEPKSNLIFHNIDDGIIKNGENKITIKVIDGVGNKTEFNSKVYWSN
ncbi:MAG: M23 family metallopeptidase [Bacteroidota bacterium]|nr:M23 family metallopeptidase [Bacteroidota bacterium]